LAGILLLLGTGRVILLLIQTEKAKPESLNISIESKKKPAALLYNQKV